jgi:predicted DNA-binding transcriptional regulator AlpA
MQESIDTADTGAVGNELVSIKTLSKRLEISEKTIWDWIYKSRREATLDPIPYYKLGALIRFSLRDIRAWLNRRRVRPGPRLDECSPRGRSGRKFVE